MRVPVSTHTALPWRIHAIAPDFHIEDVWLFKSPDAGPDDFPVALNLLTTLDVESSSNPLVAFLFTVRRKLGEAFGWDDGNKPHATLLDRLPEDLRDGPRGPRIPTFDPLYLTDNEYVAETVNGTVHAILHLGWTQRPDKTYGLQMAVLVKPNGRLGRLYMELIKPFRYAIVYPALTRKIEKRWRERAHS